MQYVGGKQKSGGAQTAGVINTLVKRRKLRTVAEPFCGGLSITYRLKAPQVHASDGCEALITLYRRMQQGWRPPDLLTREEWESEGSADWERTDDGDWLCQGQVTPGGAVGEVTVRGLSDRTIAWGH